MRLACMQGAVQLLSNQTWLLQPLAITTVSAASLAYSPPPATVTPPPPPHDGPPDHCGLPHCQVRASFCASCFVTYALGARVYGSTSHIVPYTAFIRALCTGATNMHGAA